jgi:hypothetical protein
MVSRVLGIVLSANLMMWIHQALAQNQPASPVDYGQSIAVAGAALILYCGYFAWRVRSD